MKMNPSSKTRTPPETGVSVQQFHSATPDPTLPWFLGGVRSGKYGLLTYVRSDLTDAWTRLELKHFPRSFDRDPRFPENRKLCGKIDLRSRDDLLSEDQNLFSVSASPPAQNPLDLGVRHAQGGVTLSSSLGSSGDCSVPFLLCGACSVECHDNRHGLCKFQTTLGGLQRWPATSLHLPKLSFRVPLALLTSACVQSDHSRRIPAEYSHNAFVPGHTE